MATQKNMSAITLVECPRDAMQGLQRFIPTDQKVRYLNSLLEVGFDILDFGSFVSPKAVPQMRDTEEVLSRIDWKRYRTELLGIVAGKRGIEQACGLDGVVHIGFPFSISETFQQNNTRKSREESMQTVSELLEQTAKYKKKEVVYLSMGFGNPYGDDWSLALVEDWCGRLIEAGVSVISLADTVGQATPERIGAVYDSVTSAFPNTYFGIHLHTRYDNWREKMDAAWTAGCRRYDGAIKGFGGCPFAKDELVGNLPTEKILSFCTEKDIGHQVDIHRFQSVYNMASEIFPRH